MNARVVNLEGLKICGLSCKSKNMNGEIPKLWGEFHSRKAEIKDADLMTCYGICEPLEKDVEAVDLNTPSEFIYLAGVQVNDDNEIPNGMEVWEVKHKKYLVFTHKGLVQNLGDTYKKIYGEYIPNSEYKVVFTYDFEVYGPNFDPMSPESELEIYVPVE